MSTPVYSEDLDRRLAAVNGRLAAIEAHLAVVSQALGIPYGAPSNELPADVLALIRAGKRREAITAYRAATGAGMEEAQRVIDQA